MTRTLLTTRFSLFILAYALLATVGPAVTAKVSHCKDDELGGVLEPKLWTP